MESLAFNQQSSSEVASTKLKFDMNDLLQSLCRAEKPFDYFGNYGSKTHLTPVHFIPKLNQEDYQVSLNGDWKYKKWPFNEDENSLITSERNDSQWASTVQPGKVHYYNPEEDSSLLPTFDRVTLAHIDENDGAILKRTIEIPLRWEGKRIYLCFDAIYPAGKVFCNGIFLGEHLSGLTPALWDVTPYVRPGQNATVAVRLLRKHKFIQMDMPRHSCEFTGLAQDAYLYATEQIQLYDYKFQSDLDIINKTGFFHGTLELKNYTSQIANCSVDVILSDDSGTRYAASPASAKVSPNSSQIISMEVFVNKVKFWNDENPKLYTVQIQLSSDHGAPQKIIFKTGFRKFELIDQLPTLNGNLLKLRGVDHLTYHPEYGMYTPEDWLRRCLELMKCANINAIRTHFLGPRILADLCDELGIYLIQELPIDWGHTYVHDPEFVGPALMRIEAGIKRDCHHPSILIWCVGNENLPRNMVEHDDFFNHLRIFDSYAKILDDTRPTMFPPPGPANAIEGIFESRVGTIADIHYSFKLIHTIKKTGKITNPKTWEAEFETCTRQEAIDNGWSGVWFSSEYCLFNAMPDLLNAPYNSLVADTPEDWSSGKNTMQVFIDRIASEWGLMRDDPTCLGGAMFPWMCSGSGKAFGWTRWAEDADWGVVTSDLMPKPEFWALRVMYAPIVLPARLVWSKGQTTLKFSIRNLYNNIDLKDCKFRVMMGGGLPFITFMRHWKDIPILCAPGKTEMVEIPLWNDSTLKALENNSPIVCRCTLLDPKGFRPLTHDILVIPETIDNYSEAMPIGPDAEIK